jgi:hypothetical protein
MKIFSAVRRLVFTAEGKIAGYWWERRHGLRIGPGFTGQASDRSRR